MSDAFLDGFLGGFEVVGDQLENIVLNADLQDFVSNILAFAGLFLALWGVWIGVRAILRAGRLIK